MDEETEPVTVASAVVVPGQESPPEGLKRRQRSETSEASKRPRLDQDLPDGEVQGSDAAAVVTEKADNAPSGADARSNRRRTGQEEEKRRGKRLFGALLGTIGKFQKETASQRARSSAVKRKEAEAKLQEKLKAQTEELDERKKKEDDDFNLKRRTETREFEARAMQIRHANLRSQANVLFTATAPKLFYLPWKLLPSEEDTIKAQIDSTEESIAKEEAQFLTLQGKDDEVIRAAGPDGEPTEEERTDADQEQDILIHNTPPQDDLRDTADNVDDKPARQDEHADNARDGTAAPEDNDAEGGARRHSDTGDPTEIIEEGGEDTVIY